MNKSTCKTLKDGTKKWYFKNKLHREDGPAIECANGHKEWHLNGQLHRTDGPAIEWSNGDKSWYLSGQCHREDGPAVENDDGYKAWYFQGKQIEASSLEEFQQLTGQTPQPQLETDAEGTKRWKLNGQLHRTDGPAIEYFHNTKEWYLNGRWHRADGPAVEIANGHKEWWVNGQRRADGPAVEYANGDKEWHFQGKRILASSLSEFQQLTGQISSESQIMSVFDTVKSDVTKGAFRAGAKRIPKTARAALLAFLQAKKIKPTWLKSLKEMMETEYGLALVQMGMAWTFRSLPMLKQEPRALALAEEWAIDSVAVVGDQLMNEVMLVLGPVITQVMELPTPEKIRVESKSPASVKLVPEVEEPNCPEPLAIAR